MSDSAETNSFVNFTDADLKSALQRAVRLCALLGIIAAAIFLIANGWRASVLCLAGTLVSVVGIYEWQQLIEFVNARLDKQKPPRSTVRVVTMFLLRLVFAGAVIYVSLKCLTGTPYALLAGLGLAVLALTVEAVRLIRA
jgi:uncharacterized membrane protein YidH (DUF202 family)